MNTQAKLSNGSWIDMNEDELNQCLDAAMEKTMYEGKARADLIELLSAGKTLYCGSDWYAQFRMKPAPRQPMPVVEFRCDCGHTVAKSLVMNASLGTSCPDCYDRMSD